MHQLLGGRVQPQAGGGAARGAAAGVFAGVCPTHPLAHQLHPPATSHTHSVFLRASAAPSSPRLASLCLFSAIRASLSSSNAVLCWVGFWSRIVSSLCCLNCCSRPGSLEEMVRACCVPPLVMGCPGNAAVMRRDGMQEATVTPWWARRCLF